MTEVGPFWTPARCAETSPIVLLGRGGGGTRLLSECVATLGVFMGNRLNKSHDSVEWVAPVYDLSIRQWSPGRTPVAAGGVGLRQTAAAVLNTGGVDKDQPWGWKLPETTLIAPLVRTAFPKARFIHLARHPVTTCCRRSHMTSRTDTPLGRAALAAAYRFAGRDPGLMETDPEHIRNAASWAFQADIMLRFLKAGGFDADPLLLTYEAVCDEPERTAESIGRYLGLPAPRSTAFSVDPARIAPAEIDPKQAREVWRMCEPQAIRLGYGESHRT